LEDVAQDAFCRALEVKVGIPENPAAWLDDGEEPRST
jgi:predicted RNA polymerase sigma factor